MALYQTRLAKRGFKVQAADISEKVLNDARARIKNMGLEEKISFEKQSLIDLSIPNHTFEFVICWGVLMHVPNVTKAVSELGRILKPGADSLLVKII